MLMYSAKKKVSARCSPILNWLVASMVPFRIVIDICAFLVKLYQPIFKYLRTVEMDIQYLAKRNQIILKQVPNNLHFFPKIGPKFSIADTTLTAGNTVMQCVTKYKMVTELFVIKGPSVVVVTEATH